MEEHHNMTGEKMPFTSGERVFENYNKEVKKQEVKEPYKLGIGELFLWLLFVALIVTILWQDNKIDKLEGAIVKNEAKIEFFKLKVKILKNVSER